MLKLLRPSFFTTILLLFCFIAPAESPITIKIIPEFGGKALVAGNNNFISSDNIQITIRTLKFYISNVKFVMGNDIIFAEQNSFHLLDVSDPNSLTLQFNVPEIIRFNAVVFSLGIDSVTNVSGAMGGDLDPTKGMYWTWQSGYINFKLEGVIGTTSNQENNLKLHLGGYSYPFNSLQTVSLNTAASKNVNILLDLKSLLKNIDTTKELLIMSPSQKAVELSEKIATSFKITLK